VLSCTSALHHCLSPALLPSCAGFTKREESEYDPFGAGHSSTSISAGLGMAVGRDRKGKKNHVISVIGDGAITGGMAYEAMNHAGFLDSNMIVILNDNQQVRCSLAAATSSRLCLARGHASTLHMPTSPQASAGNGRHMTYPVWIPHSSSLSVGCTSSHA
jgi:hypothetical protein